MTRFSSGDRAADFYSEGPGFESLEGDMNEDSPVIVDAARAMFSTIHGYHVDLNWDNASFGHRELYLKLARVSQPVFEEYYRSER